MPDGQAVAAMFEHFGRKAVWPGCFIVLKSLHSNIDFMEGGRLFQIRYDGQLWEKFYVSRISRIDAV